MDDDERLLSGVHDPAWAKRVTKMEKEFARADRRVRGSGKIKRVRRRGRFGIGFGVAAVMIAAVGYATVYHPWGTASSSSSVVPVMNSPAPIATDSSASTGAVAGGGGPSTTSVSPDTVSAGALGDPFAGTPAFGWPSADRGVIMPAAVQAGPISPGQVKNALAVVHRFILLSRADPAVLNHHDLSALNALVVPVQVSEPDFEKGKAPIFIPSMLAPGFVLSAPVRINGTVQVTFVPKADGYLSFSANLVWAYALVPHSDTETTSEPIVIRHEHLTLDVYPLNTKIGGKVWIESDRSYLLNIDCGYLAQGWLALPRVDDPSRRPIPSGTFVTGAKRYDPATSLDGGHSCL